MRLNIMRLNMVDQQIDEDGVLVLGAGYFVMWF